MGDIITHIFNGNLFEDDRGRLTFFNDFPMDSIKRMYQIHHESINVIRAWQGHKIENKFFYVLEGEFLIAKVAIDDFNAPSIDLIPEITKLSSQSPQILHVPNGYANGFKALTPNSRLLIFSDLDLQESKNDDYRFTSDLWFDW